MRKIRSIPPETIVRLGGMTDCMQPCELKHRVTYRAIQELNRCGIGYLIVTKSHLIASPEYLAILDKRLAHVQISVTCLDDEMALSYEKASVPSKRIAAISKLQAAGFDVSIRLSPLIEEFMDFDTLNSLNIEKCIIEFLRINSWIKKWLHGIDFSQYTVHQSNYYHLPLATKCRILEKIRIPQISVCEDVSSHYEYWRTHINPNKNDCCNLRL